MITPHFSERLAIGKTVSRDPFLIMLVCCHEFSTPVASLRFGETIFLPGQSWTIDDNRMRCSCNQIPKDSHAKKQRPVPINKLAD